MTASSEPVLVLGFVEPLYPIGPSAPDETRALNRAIASFQQPVAGGADVVDVVRPLEAFMRDHPNSVWRTGLELNLGLAYARAGYSSRAMAAFRSSWMSGSHAQQPGVTEQVDRAVAELAALLARLGRADELAQVLTQVGGRQMAGPATELMTAAREADWEFRNEPGSSFLCGPLSLRNLLVAVRADPSVIRPLDDARAGSDGTTLMQLSRLADNAGLRHQLIKRRRGEPIPVPSIVHLKLDHFAAIVDKVDDRFLVQDPSMSAGGAWISAAAIDEESSGLFLVPAANGSANWQIATPAEAAMAKGRGKTTENDDSSTRLEDPTIHPVCQSRGLCVANAKEMLASLHLSDIPVGYRPAIGPSVMVQLVYNQREARRNAIPTFFSVGQKWTMNFQSWVEDDPTAMGGGSTVLFPPGGGYVDYTSFSSPTQFPGYVEYAPDKLGGKLRRFPAAGRAVSYEYVNASGERLVYAYSDGATALTRHLFLTEIIDVNGDALHLDYAVEGTAAKPLLRLKAIRDASGGTTTFEYVPDTLWITKITDPFGRFATLQYDGLGYLNSITDVIGLTASFTYAVRSEQRIPDTSPFDVKPAGGGGFVSTGTPQGETSAGAVSIEAPASNDTSCNLLPRDERRRRCDYGLIDSMTTPYGTTHFQFGRDLVENYRYLVIRFLEAGDPDGTVEVVQFRHKAPGVASKEPLNQVPLGVTVNNDFLEYRNSYYWDKQSSAAVDRGLGALSYRDARITHWLHTKNGRTSGIPESRKRPLESRVWYLYDGQRTPFEEGASSSPSVIARRLSDIPLGNGAFQPVTYKAELRYNAAGSVVQTVESLQGQPDRVTEYARDANGIDLLAVGRRATPNAPLVELRGFSYYPDRRLKQGRSADGDKVDYVYDSLGRIKTKTVASGATHVYTYDPARPYDVKRIDVEGTQLWKRFDYDAQGRVSKATWSGGYSLSYGYDKLDRLTTITYPDNTFEQFVFDRLDLQQVISRNGHVRTYLHDGNRRLRNYSDGKSVTLLSYHKGGTLKQFTIDGGKTTSWEVDLQGRPVSKTYPDGSQETYSYDANVSLVAQWVNAAGDRSSYQYYPDNRLRSISRTNRGAPPQETLLRYADPYFKQLTSISSGSQRIELDYYEPGVAGAHHLRQERVNGQANGPLYAYDAVGRLASSTLDLTTTYTYDAIGRLKTYGGLRDFEFTYYPDTGRLNSIGSSLQTSEFGYFDNLRDQRLQVVRNRPGREYGYDYDDKGNIAFISEGLGGGTTVAEWRFGYDEVNRLIRGGKVQAQQSFGYDGSGNITTLRGQRATYNALNQITTLAPKMTERRYVYDTSSRLIEIRYPNEPDKHTRITYDALGRISTIFDDSPGKVIRLPEGGWGQSVGGVTRQLTWCGATVCQEKVFIGGGLGGPRPQGSRLYFREGHREIGGGETYYARDHLGSVRQTFSASGATLATYDYDAYGKALSGAAPPKGFAGLYFHEPSGLYMARYRVYDPDRARWITRDPLGERGGLNLYAYAYGNPVNVVDLDGLEGEAIALPVLLGPVFENPVVWPLVAPVVPYIAVGAGAATLAVAANALPPLDIGGEPGAGVPSYPGPVPQAIPHPSSEPGVTDLDAVLGPLVCAAAIPTLDECVLRGQASEQDCLKMYRD